MRTYIAVVKCSNCGWHGSVQIQKGYPISSKECQNCGCKDLMVDRISTDRISNYSGTSSSQTQKEVAE